MGCFQNHFINIEFVEALEHVARKWSDFQWRRAAYLCGLAYNFVEDSKLAQLPLPTEYRVSRRIGSIAAQVVQSGDKVAIRVYAISFSDGPFKPGRYLHRLAGRGYLRESFHICGVGRTKRVFEGHRVPWRHIPRNEIGANHVCTMSVNRIEFAWSNSALGGYSTDATAASENTKHWKPQGSHDSSLARPIEDAPVDSGVIDKSNIETDRRFARSQSSYSLGDPAHAKGTDRYDGDIKGHEDFKSDDDVVDDDWNRIPMPARTWMFDISALQTAPFAPPSRMHALTSALHAAARDHGPGHPPPRPHGSPRAH